MLWGRAASRCSIPQCRIELVVDSTETDDNALIGQAAHIVAERTDGPRGESPLTVDERNKYANLILLCNNHHKQVDDQVNDFTVDRLRGIKAEHEAWVRAGLSSYDREKQENDERWASYIDHWVIHTFIDCWLVKTSWLLAPNPSIEEEFCVGLLDFRQWVLSRLWPENLSDLKSSLENFAKVAGDLIHEFKKHSDPKADDKVLVTRKFYQSEEWDEELYFSRLRRYEFHVDLIHDLTFELTRAANYICDRVRGGLDRSFRVDQGVLLVQRSAELAFYTHRVEYRGPERIEYPYPGLESFLSIRSSRDLFLGDSAAAESSL